MNDFYDGCIKYIRIIVLLRVSLQLVIIHVAAVRGGDRMEEKIMSDSLNYKMNDRDTGRGYIARD